MSRPLAAQDRAFTILMLALADTRVAPPPTRVLAVGLLGFVLLPMVWAVSYTHLRAHETSAHL
eukprot:892877-Alexandrium_andersonii.AAC.1